MRRHIRPRFGAPRFGLVVGPALGLVLAFLTLAPVVVPPAFARRVVVQSESPFRGGPNRTFRAMGTVTVGTNAEVLGQTGGWVQLKLDDGRVGYVFQTNLRDLPDAPPVDGAPTTTLVPAAGTPPSPSPGAEAPSTTLVTPTLPAPIPDDLPSLKSELSGLRAKVDSLNDALARQRGDGTPVPGTPGDAAPVLGDGQVSMTLAALLVGFLAGFLISRLTQRRADYRQWNKLRF